MRRIGAGVDVAHQAGMPMGSVALYPASVLVWEDNWGVGLTYPIGPRVGWSGAVGGIYVYRTDGAALGIETEKANSGLNFLYLEYRYR